MLFMACPGSPNLLAGKATPASDPLIKHSTQEWLLHH